MLNNNKFFKAHALGNNFILIKTNDLSSISSKFILDYNNCFFGIGCNQVLATDQKFNVSIWNEDGSKAHLCGNGLRCLAKLLAKDKITFNTEFSGYVELENLKNNLVSMNIKLTATIYLENDHYLVNVGNLNKIFFVEDNDIVDINSFVNNEFNYSFVSRKKNKWSIRTIESCSKYETLACGSAALAAAYALKEQGHNDLTLHYPLGFISHEIKNEHIIQTGPATIIAQLLLIF